ncbi:MAG: lipid-binding SYLF domain-containing protein [Gammaproteobacteria bacterium]|nr:lipid-binding SYLF domain-containing protein [Gammaproteobacteria bacterium]
MTRLIATVAATLLGLTGLSAQASPLDIRVDTATQILQDLKRMPENAIPPALLNRAYAIAVIPSTIKAGFMFGGTFGRGIVVARRADGQWSNPAFVQLTQGSFGFQAGVQSTDLILVFKTQRALDGLASGKITLGGDASIAAGPVGRKAVAATDLRMQSEIYSYSRNRGFFAGISLQGGVLSMDRKSNAQFYAGEANPGKILFDTSIPAPTSGRRFVDTLTAMTPAPNRQPATRAASRDPEMDAPPPAGVRTYGINEEAAPAVEGSF